MIYGIEGGIGAGKTISLVYFGLNDLNDGKRLYTNIKLNVKGDIVYLTKDNINNIFELIKSGKMNMKNSTVLIQEAHNYIDSRTSMSKKNRMFGYWILQSRHTGAGSCDILFDTQDLRQIDVRLRRNTDIIFKPEILSKLNDKPKDIILYGSALIKLKLARFSAKIDVYDVCDKYDTHELVEI